jgi:hypothetical protein
MENIQIKAQRAETLQQLETEKTKILTLFCTRSCTYSYSAAKLLQKIKSKRAPASYLYDRNEENKQSCMTNLQMMYSMP